MLGQQGVEKKVADGIHVGITRPTYTISNLLPARTVSPLPLVAKTILIHIHDALTPFLGQPAQSLRAVAEFFQSPRPVAIHDNVHVCHQLLELGAAGGRLEVQICGVLAHVAVDLEERHVAQVRARDLEHCGAVLGQDPRNRRAGDYAAHLQDLDPG